MGSFDDSYYSRLELGQGASHDDVVRAYRRLAMGVHPDTRPGDPDAAGRFRGITEAYEVLGDPTRREAYDRRLGDAPIRIQVRRPFRDVSDERRQRAQARVQGDPVVLDVARDERADIPLRVGPVWHWSQSAAEAMVSDRRAPDVAELLRRVVESWWVR